MTGADPIFYTCSHGCAYSAWELEMGMTNAQAIAESERAFAEMDHEADVARETELARMHVTGELDCPWPDYADEPCEVQEPEVIHV